MCKLKLNLESTVSGFWTKLRLLVTSNLHVSLLLQKKQLGFAKGCTCVLTDGLCRCWARQWEVLCEVDVAHVAAAAAEVICPILYLWREIGHYAVFITATLVVAQVSPATWQRGTREDDENETVQALEPCHFSTDWSERMVIAITWSVIHYIPYTFSLSPAKMLKLYVYSSHAMMANVVYTLLL